MKLKEIFLFTTAVLFSSCGNGYKDSRSQIIYSIINKTNGSLHLDVNPPSGSGLGGYYELKPKEEVVFFHDEGIGNASYVIENKAMNSDFLKCLVLKKDTIPLKIDIQNSSAWTPENIGDTLVIYRLTISSDKIK